MEREDVLKSWFKEAGKLPTRQKCCELTEDEVRDAAREFDFEKVGAYIFQQNIELEESEVPTKVSWNQIYLYLILLKEKLGISFDYYEISQEDSFVERVEQIQEAFEFNKSDGEFVTTLEHFMEYQKSDNPDF